MNRSLPSFRSVIQHRRRLQNLFPPSPFSYLYRPLLTSPLSAPSPAFTARTAPPRMELVNKVLETLSLAPQAASEAATAAVNAVSSAAETVVEKLPIWAQADADAARIKEEDKLLIPQLREKRPVPDWTKAKGESARL